jgi:DNA-directed RNA polymerase specialized sigma subunit
VLLTRAEKERRVIELYEEGKTYREITKEVHISPGYISSIIRKHNGELQVGPEKAEQQKNKQSIPKFSNCLRKERLPSKLLSI